MPLDAARIIDEQVVNKPAGISLRYKFNCAAASLADGVDADKVSDQFNCVVRLRSRYVETPPIFLARRELNVDLLIVVPELCPALFPCVCRSWCSVYHESFVSSRPRSASQIPDVAASPARPFALKTY